jgi:4-amino-4-deoxy-L-arabinose transferase-like glycosyltransferase
MLTYNPIKKPKRKDRPWLLFVMRLIWVLGTAFFHSPWEPYETFVLSVVKGILSNHSWLVPYVSNLPYLEIQPFYFWIYSAFLKLFNITDIYSIANSIRIINTLIIFAIVILAAQIGSNLSAFKNGRTVVLILISSLGFINNAYQLSPAILIFLGFCLYIYALQLHHKLPGISGWLLFLGLLLISINFTCEFIIIALVLLMILPIIDKYWRTNDYLLTVIIGIAMFGVIFSLYCYQLHTVNSDFFIQWRERYGTLYNPHGYNFWHQLLDVVGFLGWYIVPGWFLVIWSVYKRRMGLFKDKIIQVNIVLAILIFLFSLLGGRTIESVVFPILLPVVFIASLEIDSVRISIVSLLNWFSICIFGVIGLAIWLIYIGFNFDYPPQLISYILKFSQDYHYKFNIWQLSLAILMTFIWLFMITRRHIRGRELVTNWASSTTYVIILFLSLCLPCFDAILSFKPIVFNSLPFIDRKACIVTNSEYSTQAALWYYYADLNLIPSFVSLNFSVCNQAVVATDDINKIDLSQWKIIWQGKRPIDKKIYYVMRHK